MLTAAVPVALADEAPWGGLFGQPLVPFPEFVNALGLDPSPPPEPCVLRRTALLGAALGLPEALLPDGWPVLRRVLAQVRGRLPGTGGG